MRRMLVLLAPLAILAGCLGPLATTFNEQPTLPDISARWAHARITSATGEILYSTWPGENGTLAHLEIEEPRPFAWPRGAIPDRLSVWSAFAQALADAPPNSTLRFERHIVPELRQERLEIPRHLNVPRYEIMAREQAGEALANATAGQRVYYLGLVPVDILAADADQVVFRYAIDEPMRFPLPRSSGLDLAATPLPGGSIRFTLDAPDGSFTAHKNCQAPQQLLASGFYIVRESRDDSYVVDRYVGAIEPALVGRSVDLEVRFFDGGDVTNATLHHHDHEQDQ